VEKALSTTLPAGATPLRKMLDPHHLLFILAEAINWQAFDEQLGALYADCVSRPLFLLV